jgi:hypothetical protein
MGNAVSNQRSGYVSAAPAWYTEDGALFEVTFESIPTVRFIWPVPM